MLMRSRDHRPSTIQPRDHRHWDGGIALDLDWFCCGGGWWRRSKVTGWTEDRTRRRSRSLKKHVSTHIPTTHISTASSFQQLFLYIFSYFLYIFFYGFLSVFCTFTIFFLYFLSVFYTFLHLFLFYTHIHCICSHRGSLGTPVLRPPISQFVLDLLLRPAFFL